MRKIVLACDLDNTIIHSYKHKTDGDICIEYKEGKEQGFIPQCLYDLLKNLDETVRFVPITSRSVAQYRRIQWPKDIEPEFAITTNGGLIVYRNGREERWLTPGGKNDFPQWLNTVDDTYSYFACTTNEEAALLYKRFKGNPLVYLSGRKLYFCPKDISKGLALKKVKQREKPDMVISAGDSEMDKSMDKESDIFLYPAPEMSVQEYHEFLAEKIPKFIN